MIGLLDMLDAVMPLLDGVCVESTAFEVVACDLMNSEALYQQGLYGGVIHLQAVADVAKKILEDKVPGIRVPVYEEEKLRNALLSGKAAHVTPSDALYLQLYFEFGGTK